MDGAERPSRRPSGLGGLSATLVALALALAIGGAACTPPLPPPQTPPKKPDPVPAAAPAEPGSEAAADSPPPHDATLIVIDPGDPDADSHPSLVEASKREKERKAKGNKSVAVITDETLPKLAKKGSLTFADLAKTKPGERPPVQNDTSTEQEQYWRGRARAIRQRWRDAVDEGVDLERQAAEYRRKFYAEADPFRRDGEIKPSWDRTLDRLRLAKERADAAKKELGEFLEEGRRAAALPGWLREGAELEPEPPAPPKTTADAIEPPIYKPKDEM
ncbi:MAG: hypothetical protein ABJC13_17140 [Acidobacteriota bacterium]